jgi:hypothetical protein
MSTTPLADQLASISTEEFNRYIEQFRPLEAKTIASLNESSVGTSMAAAQTDAVASRASLARMRERYGANVTPAQAAGEARRNALSASLSELSAGNNAIVSDRDNRTQTLAGLMNTGGTIRQQALGNFSSASSLEGTRSNADSANKSNYTAQKAATQNSNVQSGAALAATAAMIF